LAAHFVSVSEMASQRFSRLLKILAGAVADTDGVFQLHGRLERFVHFWALVVRQFIRHRCFVRASALSYSTLLALIPLLAVTLNVSSSLFGHQNEEKLTQFVEKTVSRIAGPAMVPANSPPVISAAPMAATNAVEKHYYADESTDTNTLSFLSGTNTPAPAETGATINTQEEIARWIHNLVQKTSNGALGVFGMIGLIITAISLLRGIEDTFNDLWGVTRGRSWLQQITLYSALIIWGPALLSTTLFLPSSAYFENTRNYLESSVFLGPLVRHLVPLVILSLALGLFYKLTPNTKVEFKAAMIGGFCAGATWHFYNQLSFLLASRALSANKLYGSIFLFVLLMVGLYFLWVIVLFGAQMAYAYQNRVAYLQDRLAENVNQRGREFVALRIMTCVGQRFYQGQCPATVPQISTELGVPSRLTQSVLRILAAKQLVSEVIGAEAAFTPARPLDAISAYDILNAMRTGTGQELPMSGAPELAEIYGEFARIESAERNAAASVTLLALASRASHPPALAEPKNLEIEKPVVVQGATVKMAGPEPVELPKPAPFLDKIETPEPAMEEEPPRRETVRPEENTDFPL
jgi:membrane protein